MEWFEEIRKEFPLVQEQIYMNVAARNPMATSVIEAMDAFWESLSRSSGASYDILRMVETVRSQVADLVNLSPKGIAFTRNTTEGINMVAAGLPWQAGDSVVISDIDHPANCIPWLNLARRGVRVKVALSDNHRIPVERVLAQVDDRTRVVAISWVQFTTGLRADLTSIGESCRPRDIFLVVDGVQGLGSLRFDADELLVDAVSAGAYKHLLGGPGTGFLGCAPRLLQQVEPAYAGVSDVLSLNRTTWRIDVSDPLDARRLEYGAMNYSGIAGLGQGLSLLSKASKSALESRILSLSSRLAEGLASLGFQVISSREPEDASGLVCVHVPDAPDLDRYLLAHGIKAGYRTDHIERLSVHAFNLEWEVDRVLEVAGGYAGKA